MLNEIILRLPRIMNYPVLKAKASLSGQVLSAVTSPTAERRGIPPPK